MRRLAGRADVGQCPHCLRELPLDMFYHVTWQDRRWSPPRERVRYSSYCKGCVNAVGTASQQTPEGKRARHERYKASVAADPEGWRVRWRTRSDRWRRAHGIPPSTKGTRTCRQCGERKPHAAFPTPTGRLCAECKPGRPEPLSPEEKRQRHRARIQRWCAANPERWREINRRSNRKYYATHRKKRVT